MLTGFVMAVHDRVTKASWEAGEQVFLERNGESAQY
jgi:hypothetical protein